MNKKLKDGILMLMGLVISIAGIIYIIRQYSKLLSTPTQYEANERNERVVKKIHSHFKQIHNDEGTSPDQIDEGDLAIELQ